ncbi:hypothetical protein N7508_006031 [Penicillium antarcticum]|uniref:uncharacterized protein n=1 Tax=Penicillium antarcticum TaxID=416450 RepID=UPI00238392E3|nr:uncharacterized protein N7508_006031 [Penicillium antarcticum]KAJ5307016.1 hypothetical protein N7508_006031 [Penicillium antarcticum]
MDFNEKYRMQNLTQALPLELALQVIGTVLGYIFITLVTPSSRVWILQSHLWSIIGFQAVKMIFVILTSGRDSNHLIYETAPKDPNWIFVGPEFHALHHVYPDRYMGSFVKLFDWVWGTAYSFRGKRFVITGGNRSFGQAMVTELEREGVQNIRNLKFGEDWDHENFAKAASALSSCDILILAHTSRGEDAMKSNCDSAVRLVELFKQHREKNISNPTLPEVWYVGSEAEMLPPFGNAELQRYSDSKRRFLPHARSYYDDTEILYRHIMPSAVSSADWTAKCSMWWIRRGVRYIPISHTGIAYLNYFKFMYWTPYAQDMDRL